MNLIIGFGVVGQSLGNYFDYKGIEYNIIDPRFNDTNLNEINLNDYNKIFICINVLNDAISEGQDTKTLYEILNTIESKDFSGLVVIRSTLLPSNVDFIESEYKLKFVAWPEFLTEVESLKHAKYHIIGANNIMYAQELIKMLDTPYDICSLREAMEVKYARNALGALKVLFFHELNEAGFNVRKIELLLNEFEDFDPQGLMAKLCVDGKKGFGGKCFPKDIQALIFESNKQSKQAGNFFRNILEANNQLRYCCKKS